MFIVIDGADGTGKTTFAKALVNGLENSVYTCEPTKPIPDDDDLLDFFIQDRKEHQIQINQWLSEGKHVICDRYKYSTIAYQQLQGHSVTRLIEINDEFLKPDVAFILIKDIDTLMNNIKKRGEPIERFEVRETQIKVLNMFKKMPEYFIDEKIILLD